jgi:hypothetical protein
MSNIDPLDLDAISEAAEKEQKAKKLKQVIWLDDLRWVLTDKRGRRFMWWLLSITGFFKLSYSGNNDETNFNEGNRNVGLQLMNGINQASPDSYSVMMKEHLKDAENDNGK